MRISEHETPRTFKPGQRVRLTGDFLRNTGQQVGGEGFSRWIVQLCPCRLCKDGRYVATNERSYDNPDRPRHIAAGNLERCR